MVKALVESWRNRKGTVELLFLYEKQVSVAKMPFNTNKCHSLQDGSRNIKNDYAMCSIEIKSIHSIQDLGATVVSCLKFSRQSNKSVKKANRMIGLIRR